jgi:polyphenol oxidase
MARELFTGKSGNFFNNPSALAEINSLTSLAFMKQVHGDRVVQVDLNSASNPTLPECDSLVTKEKGVGLVVTSADCLPVLFSSKTVVAATHAGRKGLVVNILSKTVATMQSLGATEIKAVIGPSICGKCYEVSPEMFQELGSVMPGIGNHPGHLDLKLAARLELESLGVEVRDVGICTKEDPEYFSFRRDATALRQYGVISL